MLKILIGRKGLENPKGIVFNSHFKIHITGSYFEYLVLTYIKFPYVNRIGNVQMMLEMEELKRERDLVQSELELERKLHKKQKVTRDTLFVFVYFSFPLIYLTYST